MCGSPKIVAPTPKSEPAAGGGGENPATKAPEPVRYQASRSPVYRGTQQNGSGSGRRGTILTGGSGVTNSAPTLKKTALGQ